MHRRYDDDGDDDDVWAIFFFIPTEENGENGFYEVVKKYAIGWLAVLYLLVLEIPLSTHIN